MTSSFSSEQHQEVQSFVLASVWGQHSAHFVQINRNVITAFAIFRGLLIDSQRITYTAKGTYKTLISYKIINYLAHFNAFYLPHSPRAESSAFIVNHCMKVKKPIINSNSCNFAHKQIRGAIRLRGIHFVTLPAGHRKRSTPRCIVSCLAVYFCPYD